MRIRHSSCAGASPGASPHVHRPGVIVARQQWFFSRPFPAAGKRVSAHPHREDRVMNKKLPLLCALLPLALVACRGDEGDPGQQNGATAGTSAGSMSDPGPASSAMGGTTGDATGSAAMDPTAGTSMAAGGADRKALLAVEEVDRHEIAAAEDAI